MGPDDIEIWYCITKLHSQYTIRIDVRVIVYTPTASTLVLAWQAFALSLGGSIPRLVYCQHLSWWDLRSDSHRRLGNIQGRVPGIQS